MKKNRKPLPNNLIKNLKDILLIIWIILILFVIIFIDTFVLHTDKIYHGNFHTHINYSLEEGEHWETKGVSPSYDKMINEAARIGLDFIVITSYDLVSGEVKEKCPNEKRVLCIIGEETNPSDHRHIIAVNINKTIKSMLTPQQTIDEIHNQGGIAILAHPYSEQEILDGFTLGVDAVECFNPRNNILHMDNITKVAKKLNLPCVYISDAHAIEHLNKAYSKCYMKKLTKENILKAVKTGKCKPIINTKIFEPANYSNFFSSYITLKGCLPKQCLNNSQIESDNIKIQINFSKTTIYINKKYDLVTKDLPVCDDNKDFSNSYITFMDVESREELNVTLNVKEEIIKYFKSVNLVYEINQTCSLILINILEIEK